MPWSSPSRPDPAPPPDPWHQGARQATLAEIFPDTAVDGAATGFALAHLVPQGGPVLWIQDRLSRKEAGRPYLAGLGIKIELLWLEVSRPVDVLWAMEQGLGTPALGAVIGEVWGEAPVLDFTATKRLALRSEAQGVPAWLIRRAAQADLSAARERWRVASLPSGPVEDDMRAPGAATWRATLFRARWRPPGEWVVRHDRTAHKMDISHPTAADGSAAAGPSVAGPSVSSAAGASRHSA